MRMNKTTTAASAGIGGAIVGAGIAAVATKVLSDKKNRDKAGQILEDVREKISDLANKDIQKSKTSKSVSRSVSRPRSKAKSGVVASTKVKEDAKEALQSKKAPESQT